MCSKRKRKSGETAATVLTLPCKPAGRREQLKQGSSKGGCCCSRSMGVSAWWEEFWPGWTKFPQGLVFQPSSSARSNISCTIVPSVARPKPRSSDKNRIQVFKLRSGGVFHLMYIRPALGHVCYGQIYSYKSQPPLNDLKH